MRSWYILIVLMSLLQVSGEEYKSDFKGERVWTGPEFWARPLEGWRVTQGRVESAPKFEGGRDYSGQSLHLLTHFLNDKNADFTAEVIIGIPKEETELKSGGFRLGIRSDQSDPRSAIFRWRSHQRRQWIHGAWSK